MARDHRRLAAIVSADVAGYSRLMAQDESGTLATFKAHRRELIDRKIAEFDGRIVKTTGDGLLLEFASVVDAVLCAVDVQRGMAGRNAAVQSERRIVFRIGINVGDIILDDDDIFGDGVNVAARMQTLAEPGGICVSRAVRDQVLDKLPCTFEELGAKWVKNIPRPIEVYRIDLELPNTEYVPLAQPKVIEAVAKRAPNTRADNLPHPLTSFVGREHDIATCAKLLDDARLLTLTGIGGCGKTRLAIRVAERLHASFPGNVRFVDLAPIAEPERVALAVATAFDVREEVDRTIEETLVLQLAGRLALLVLDNCEHLLGACASLAERLLLAAPELRVLATSREGLGVAGEQIFAVRSLSIPGPGGAELEKVRGCEAIQLFVERAAHVVPQFRLNAANVASVVEICRRLDGIPLALELAVGRLKVLSIDQVRAKLGDRFALLGGRSRALSRHQTLLATLQWSYDHLTPDEQRWLQRLSVFAGGWTLEAAAAVAGEHYDEADALEPLERLVDLSLVQVERSTSGAPRYGMLETVRQFAYDRLVEAGKADAARSRHLEYFLALSERAYPNFRTREAKRWGVTVDHELSNLLAAHAWCDHDADGPERGQQLAFNLRVYWIERGLVTLGWQVLTEALGRLSASDRSMTRALALYALGVFERLSGRIVESIPHVEEALAIAREHRDEERIIRCLNNLAWARAYLGDPSAALPYLDEMLEICPRSGLELSLALCTKGMVCRMLSDFDAATAALEEALTLLDDNEIEHLHVVLEQLARVAMACGALDRARESLIELIGISQELDSAFRAIISLDVAALLAATLGEWERAARLQSIFDATYNRMGGFGSFIKDGEILEELRTKPREMLGEDAYVAAYLPGREVPLEQALSETLAWLQREADTKRPQAATTRAF